MTIATTSTERRALPSALVVGGVALAATMPLVMATPAAAAPIGDPARAAHVVDAHPIAPAAARRNRPATHEVHTGDTVSSIAARYGLSTARVLAWNGLSWRSLIFPGQQLTLRAPDSGHRPASDPAAGGCDSARYTIVPGDTVGTIAERFGVEVGVVLEANRLRSTSLIFPGRTLVIPSPTRLVDECVVEARLTPAMRRNARIIIEVGRDAGVSDRGIVVALAAAAQESGLRNLRYGDLDSLGVFQQRPSAGWGTPDQVLDPRRAAAAFFGGPGNPNPGRTRGLLDVAGWQRMSITDAAQAVQRSATPRAYQKWASSARHWLQQLG